MQMQQSYSHKIQNENDKPLHGFVQGQNLKTIP